MKHISLIALFVVFASCSQTPETTSQPALGTEDVNAVAAAVQHTFDGLALHDSTMLATVILPDANFQRWGADSTGTWRTVNMSGGGAASPALDWVALRVRVARCTSPLLAVRSFVDGCWRAIEVTP